MKVLVVTRKDLLPKFIILIFMIMFLRTTGSLAQDVKELTYYATEEVKTQSPPSFPGGHAKLKDFIRNEVEKSPNKIRLGRKTTITAKIDEAGKVFVLKPAYNADPPLEKELKRIALLMPTWRAGMVNGKGVVTDYTFVMKRDE
jgi:hypothetical protein